MPLSTFKKIISPFSSGNIGANLTRDIVWDRPLFRPPTLPNPRVMFDPQPFTTQRPLLKRVTTERKSAKATAHTADEPTGIRRWLFATHRERPLHSQSQFV